MKVEIEIRSDISRRELHTLTDIAIEAASRLAHRMTAVDLARLQNAGAMLAGVADRERRKRAVHIVEFQPVPELTFRGASQ